MEIGPIEALDVFADLGGFRGRVGKPMETNGVKLDIWTFEDFGDVNIQISNPTPRDTRTNNM